MTWRDAHPSPASAGVPGKPSGARGGMNVAPLGGSSHASCRAKIRAAGEFSRRVSAALCWFRAAAEAHLIHHVLPDVLGRGAARGAARGGAAPIIGRRESRGHAPAAARGRRAIAGRRGGRDQHARRAVWQRVVTARDARDAAMGGCASRLQRCGRAAWRAVARARHQLL
eukprot:5833055-Prymnesium_polylepis.1